MLYLLNVWKWPCSPDFCSSFSSIFFSVDCWRYLQQFPVCSLEWVILAGSITSGFLGWVRQSGSQACMFLFVPVCSCPSSGRELAQDSHWLGNWTGMILLHVICLARACCCWPIIPAAKIQEQSCLLAPRYIAQWNTSLTPVHHHVSNQPSSNRQASGWSEAPHAGGSLVARRRILILERLAWCPTS